MTFKVEGANLDTVIVSVECLKKIKIISSSIPIKHVNKQVALDNKAVERSLVSALNTIVRFNYTVTVKLNTNNVSIVITSGVGHHSDVCIGLKVLVKQLGKIRVENKI